MNLIALCGGERWEEMVIGGGAAYRRAEGGGLGDELAGAGAVEAPAVVHALEAALVVDASLGERREAVRAGVVEHAPLAGAGVVPGDDAEPEHRLAVRRARVEVAHGGQRVPLVQPVEPLLPGRRRRRRVLGARRLGRHGGRRQPGGAAPPRLRDPGGAAAAQPRGPQRRGEGERRARGARDREEGEGVHGARGGKRGRNPTGAVFAASREAGELVAVVWRETVAVASSGAGSGGDQLGY
jgi:hypothetical protein